MKKSVIYLVLLAILIYLAAFVVPRQRADVEEVEREAREGLDIPTGVELPAFTNEEDELIIEHTGFTLSYNLYTNCPKWVAWELTSDEAKSHNVSRSNAFKSDEELPPLNQTEPRDYYGSGYTRGHMCPSGDMKWDQQAMDDCFLMSNICPQTKVLNAQWWEHVETACREWAKRYGSVYICCGPIYNDNTPDRYIGSNEKIRVPDAFFKVVLTLAPGHEQAIGFVYSNTNQSQPIDKAATTVDYIEQVTGYDFFTSLPDDIEDRLESQFDLKQW